MVSVLWYTIYLLQQYLYSQLLNRERLIIILPVKFACCREQIWESFSEVDWENILSWGDGDEVPGSEVCEGLAISLGPESCIVTSSRLDAFPNICWHWWDCEASSWLECVGDGGGGPTPRHCLVLPSCHALHFGLPSRYHQSLLLLFRPRPAGYQENKAVRWSDLTLLIFSITALYYAEILFMYLVCTYTYLVWIYLTCVSINNRSEYAGLSRPTSYLAADMIKIKTWINCQIVAALHYTRSDQWICRTIFKLCLTNCNSLQRLNTDLNWHQINLIRQQD